MSGAVGARTYRSLSLVLPVYRQADHIAPLVGAFEEALERVDLEREVLLVVNGPDDGTLGACHRLAQGSASVRVIESGAGWGRAVRAGLAEATGDLLCYTNSARTVPEDLLLVVLYAVAYPGVVVKAQRRTRDSVGRRVGSLLYNLECRKLFDLATFDVNGTPKAFPAELGQLRRLTRNDDVIDAEFVARCRREGYRLVDVPIVSTQRHGGTSTTNWRSALRLYLGAVDLRRRMGPPTPGVADR